MEEEKDLVEEVVADPEMESEDLVAEEIVEEPILDEVDAVLADTEEVLGEDEA